MADHYIVGVLFSFFFFWRREHIYKRLLSELYLRNETELGDNNSIKNPAPIESSRSMRRKEKDERQKCVEPIS